MEHIFTVLVSLLCGILAGIIYGKLTKRRKLNSQRCLFTKGDSIRAMSDEELAEWIVGIVSCVSCERINGIKNAAVQVAKICGFDG